jgi:nitroreductase
MADNYLEKRQEEMAHAKKMVVHRNHLSLDTLLRRNRSYRGFSGTVSEAQLRELVGVMPLVASGMNRQALRFRLVCGASEASLVHPLVTLGAALPEEHLPHPGMEPSAYIVICQDLTLDERLQRYQRDVGIVAQTMLLAAVEEGFGGCMIGNFDAGQVRAAANLPEHLHPMLVVAFGKPAETIVLTDVPENGDIRYYRDADDVHYVPKRRLEDLLIP